MTFNIEDSALWRKTLSHRAKDAHEKPRERLRVALGQMRDSVSLLVSEIPADCRDLTVHDISHLDALWEMADLIAGDGFDLNPAEAFVFGAAVLLHDAGTSFAAFAGGLDEVRKTKEWRDTAISVLKQNGYDPAQFSAGQQLPKDVFDHIAFAVLRKLHAKQAENLATQSWTLPSGAQVNLLNDTELRQAFGRLIGRVAHSHHWDIDRVAQDLRDNIGTGIDLPAGWVVNERKIACLLRCADAAHIDRRRAPTILFASKGPTGISTSHWSFQNKINKPSVDGNILIYSAGSEFTLDDADSWWMAFDLIRLIDKEIRTSNSLLEELAVTPFKIQRVQGAESPRALSKYITPKGWRPVNTEIRVSDPAHLAMTLGGANLYGNDPRAAIRELLQNAVDAVRARRELQRRPAEWGDVRLTLSVEGEEAWLYVDDQGIGMSERILTGPLLTSESLCGGRAPFAMSSQVWRAPNLVRSENLVSASFLCFCWATWSGL